MKKIPTTIVRVTEITVWLTFALCVYCWYLSEDYNRFYPQTKEQTALRIKDKIHD